VSVVSWEIPIDVVSPSWRMNKFWKKLGKILLDTTSVGTFQPT